MANDDMDLEKLRKAAADKKKQNDAQAAADDEEKSTFHFDKKLWTIFGIVAIVIVVAACAFAFL